MTIKRREFFQGISAGAASLIGSPGNLFGQDPVRSDFGTLYMRKKLQADILVAGGGLAGVCAAIAAARNGASVILLQDRSRLGGNSSSEIRMHVLGANSHKDTSLWRETGIIEELKLTDSTTNLQRSFEMWDLLLYNKVVSEKRISLMLDTALIDAAVQNDAITTVKAVSPLVEELYEIEARYFLDCTGDARLAAACGARCMRGREGRDVYGESLAPEKSDLKTMGNSILLFARKHPQPMPFRAPSWARSFADADFKYRPIHSYEYGYWWIELGGELDTIKDNQKLRYELLRVVLGVWDYLKNSGKHSDSANWALDWVGMIPGKRESRRIAGDHVMIQQELERCEPYPDRVAYGGWPIDDHPPGGMDRTDIQPFHQVFFKQPYHIPLRSLYSSNRSNLLMAGRNISASHVALASTRVMATCATIGQAAGTAAAFCVQHHCSPQELAGNKNLLAAYQQKLLRDDQAVIGVRNEDPEDLARHARITASSETSAGKAVNIIDGWNRNIGDGLTHQWQAPMQEGEPWLQLSCDQARSVREIQLTFDSGLHGRLYLTGQDSEYKTQTRGPQPETVADYSVEAMIGGTWRRIFEARDNFLRLVRHTFEPVATSSVRVIVKRTNGDTLARIFEVRCYT